LEGGALGGDSKHKAAPLKWMVYDLGFINPARELGGVVVHRLARMRGV